MIINNYGYACINHGLNTSTPRVSSSRTIRKATYDREGLEKAGELSLLNLKDLLVILKWNEENNVKLFRMSSDIFPWKVEWDFNDLKEKKEVFSLLSEIGNYAKKNNHRLTFHPGPYNKLCSSNSKIISNTIKELEMHSEIMDLMGLSQTFYNNINIHIGASYGNRELAAKVWVKNWKTLSDGLKKRLTLENDDKKALFSCEHIYKYVYEEIGIPIVFDFHHHRCYSENPEETEQSMAEIALTTWPKEITPKFHWSESRRDELNDPLVPISSHSDLCVGPLPKYNLSRSVDLMIEAKRKELAMFSLINNENTNTN